MTAYPRREQEEIERSRERGMSDRWGVQDTERQGDWLLVSFENRRIYAPLEHKEIPHQFAKIARADEALLVFTGDYGRLGWHELASEAEFREWRRFYPWVRRMTTAHKRLLRKFVADDDIRAAYAEPVEWIRAHAHTIDWCLSAGHALRIEQPRLKAERCEELATQLPSPFGCRSSIQPGLGRECLAGKIPPQQFIGTMLEDYLWLNLKGVRRRVQYRGGRLYSMWGGHTLLESIYTLVTDAVTGGRLAQCQANGCGAVFLQTHERQRFCPPREGQEKSTCMNRERVQRYRRNRKENGRGKETRTRRR